MHVNQTWIFIVENSANFFKKFVGACSQTPYEVVGVCSQTSYEVATFGHNSISILTPIFLYDALL